MLNKVTISGKTLTTGSPQTVTKGAVTTTTTKTTAVAITNSTILDILVTQGAIASKTNYTIIELRGDQGEPEGFYAFNSRTGDTVYLDISFSTDALVRSQTSTDRATGGVTTTTRTYADTGVASVDYFGTLLSAFYSAKSATGTSKIRSGAEVTTVTYDKLNYTATMRGQGPGTTASIIDARVSSSFNRYITLL